MNLPMMPPSFARRLLERLWDGGWNEPEDRQLQHFLHDYLAALGRPPPVLFTSRHAPAYRVWTFGEVGREAPIKHTLAVNLGLAVLHLAASSPGQRVDVGLVAPGLKEKGDPALVQVRKQVTYARGLIREHHHLLADMLEGVKVSNDFTAIYTPRADDPDIITKTE